MSLVVEILESFLGRSKGHNHSSGQMQFDCPACSEDEGMPDGDGKGNLEVNYNKGFFHCWRCGDTNRMKGNLAVLIKRYGNDKILRDFYLVKPEFKQKNELGETEDMKLPESFMLLDGCNPKHYKYNDAMLYLTKRGITSDIIKQYRIGFCNSGKYANRIIIPSYDSNNELNFFIGRAFYPKSKPKVLNEEAEKSLVVFNEYHINWDATIYLVEGPFDHVVTPNSIPLLGKFVHPYLFHLLQTKAKGDIVVVLDGDAWEDTKKLYRQLNTGNLRGRVRVVQLGEKYDPSLINEKFGRKKYMKVLGQSKIIAESIL
jgi:DNA primase